jgi:two-component system sensor histidine kinase QseC
MPPTSCRPGRAHGSSPLLDALNHLFTRTQEMMTRERRFTSDAAHELRSPLAALKVQTDVAQLSQDDPQAQEKALAQLHAGSTAHRGWWISLTLSRLDSLDNLDDVEPPMADVLQSAVLDLASAQQAGIDIRLHVNAPQVTHTGSSCCSACWCNLLDNAVRSPRGSVVNAGRP